MSQWFRENGNRRHGFWKMKYFGHIKCHSGLERMVIEGMIPGVQGWTWPWRRWQQDIKEILNMTLEEEEEELAKDRGAVMKATIRKGHATTWVIAHPTLILGGITDRRNHGLVWVGSWILYMFDRTLQAFLQFYLILWVYGYLLVKNIHNIDISYC